MKRIFFFILVVVLGLSFLACSLVEQKKIDSLSYRVNDNGTLSEMSLIPDFDKETVSFIFNLEGSVDEGVFGAEMFEEYLELSSSILDLDLDAYNGRSIELSANVAIESEGLKTKYYFDLNSEDELYILVSAYFADLRDALTKDVF